MATDKKSTTDKKPGKNYSLIREIRKDNLYKSNIGRRNSKARQEISEQCEISGPSKIMPGQLISFNYLQPKTMEELEYYDAMPVTIFFGVFNTDQGRRIMGFNIHYYPPRIRFQIMDRIFEIWKPMYLKAWENGLKGDLTHFDYKWLQMQLENAGLGFGVRMYIPNLTGAIRVVPPKLWVKAVFTEGVFKKKTRDAILKYWAQYRKKN
jgi:hypothetical protein